MIHIPVLAGEVLDALDLEQRSNIIDATIGLGGHSRMILKDRRFTGKIFAIDVDPQHVSVAKKNLQAFQDRVSIRQGNFSDLGSLVKDEKISFDGILFDLGVASPHLDNPQRGFSFKVNAPLDMRMNQTSLKKASDILNGASKEELQRIFRDYGEEKMFREIAAMIVDQRRIQALTTTLELSDLVAIAYRRKGWKVSRRHPATKVFQAIRIAVNDELASLQSGLSSAMNMIAPFGRIVVISYHSLEDGIVKEIFRNAKKSCLCPPEIPLCRCGKKSEIQILSKKPITPSRMECQMNPRARSAKMRVAEKI